MLGFSFRQAIISTSISRLIFWHQEVASGPFCFLVNSSWLLVFILLVFSIFISGFNLYCWKGIHFSFSLDLVFLLIFFGLIICFHYWFRDLLRELLKKYEVLLIILFLGFLLFLISEGLLFVSFFWTSVEIGRKKCLEERNVNIAKDRKVIPDPIDDRKFHE